MKSLAIRFVLLGYWLTSGLALAGPEESAAAGADDAARARWQLGLRTAEQDVTSLKEMVYRAKSSLQMLQEASVVHPTGGSRVVVRHDNRLGRAYTLRSMRYFLDGKNVFARRDPSLDRAGAVVVLDRTLLPGPHNLQVDLGLGGRAVAMFRYLQAYSFELRSSHSFTVIEGETATVTAVARQQGGFGTTYVGRPTVRYEDATAPTAP